MNLGEKRSTNNESFYNEGVCGSILFSNPTDSAEKIFGFIRHNDIEMFRRSFDIFHDKIAQMTNFFRQSVLHLIVIDNWPLYWIRLLMIRGADLLAQDHDGYTPAHYAVERDNLPLLKALTTKFDQHWTKFSSKPFEQIHENALQALRKRNHFGLTVFMLACQQKSMKCLNYLIELNIDDTHLQVRHSILFCIFTDCIQHFLGCFW